MMAQARDFRDETEALYGLVADLGEAAFEQPTQFKGWTINTVLGHLHAWNHAAWLALTDEAALMDFLTRVRAALADGSLRAFEAGWLDGLAGEELRESWRGFVHETAEAYGAADPKARVKWAGPDMSTRSAITARQMETWAHGQAIFDALGQRREDKDRIRNIAVLGVNTFGWTFANRGLPVPKAVPRVRLTAPSGDLWEWYADNRTDRVEGSASEFCQVVTQTRNVADTRLEVRGATAAQWMANAQCFAGPPHPPPAPGTRFQSE